MKYLIVAFLLCGDECLANREPQIHNPWNSYYMPHEYELTHLGSLCGYVVEVDRFHFVWSLRSQTFRQLPEESSSVSTP